MPVSYIQIVCKHMSHFTHSPVLSSFSFSCFFSFALLLVSIAPFSSSLISLSLTLPHSSNTLSPLFPSSRFTPSPPVSLSCPFSRFSPSLQFSAVSSHYPFFRRRFLSLLFTHQAQILILLDLRIPFFNIVFRPLFHAISY